MRNYMEEYQRWLDSPALSNAEWEELNAIRDDNCLLYTSDAADD